MNVPERMAALRAFMRAHDVDAIVIPSHDPHGSEHVAAHWQTRAWFSGFEGSAGTLVVTSVRAALWTDARYLLRATEELDGSGIELIVAAPPWAQGIAAWLAVACPDGGSLGYDGTVNPEAEILALEGSLAGTGVTLRSVGDPADAIRTERPPLPAGRVERFDARAAGESTAAKLDRIRDRLRGVGADVHLVTALDDIAWTLNLRGDDVAFHPVTIAYLVVTMSNAHLFVHLGKVATDVRGELKAVGVHLHPYDAVHGFVAALPGDATVWFDPAKTNQRLRESIPATCSAKPGTSIPETLKAIKNVVELDGIRDAHLRDGIAFVTLLHALATRPLGERWTEVTVAERLEAIRSRDVGYRGPSFSTIVGYRANSAVGHYQPRRETTPTLSGDGMLLIDAGAHGDRGTTDTTRTVALSAPSPEERLVYTTVLRSLIRLSTAVFPEGTAGTRLDALARDPLWRHGWECRHGIGHGIGHVLAVHEGPQRFAPGHAVGLVPGMVTTCEPGVYFAGRFGVRLENVLLAVEHAETAFGRFCAFETLTLCPFDRTLIDVAHLAADERAWIDAYHERVAATLAPELDGAARAWLLGATRPL